LQFADQQGIIGKLEGAVPGQTSTLPTLNRYSHAFNFLCVRPCNYLPQNISNSSISTSSRCLISYRL